jgi:uncharacterized protein YjbI with pentapeptide repeats
LQRIVFGEKFIGTNFYGGYLSGALATHTSFEHAEFGDAYLFGASFLGCNFSDANFSGTRMNGTVFLGGTVERARFDGAVIDGTSFEGAEMENAWLFEADLSQAINLTLEQLKSTLGDCTTKIPKNLMRPSPWPDRELSHDERVEWKERGVLD